MAKQIPVSESNEGDVVAATYNLLLTLDDKAAVRRVVAALGQLFGNFYVESNS